MDQKKPKILRDFLIYLTAIKGKSKRTRDEYEYDLTLFLRFTLSVQQDKLEQIDTIEIHSIDASFFKEITLEDMYLFLEYCEERRKNSAHTRARKVATLRSFFKYLKSKRHIIEENPADDLETPKIGKKQPIYLSLDEAKTFMGGIQYSAHYDRDYCMMTFFLNLGIRVSELCNLNMDSIHERTLTVRGKGDKERSVYLNDACLKALKTYLEHERNKMKNADKNEALFLSQKGTRLTRQRIAKIVKAINLSSGLEKKKLSPHKLRHTSATMMYKSGADIRSLQQILGHSNVSTTQIYTHVENEEIQRVIENNPLNIL
ncbi:tyrosine recombinase XerC [Rummeliibacillus stabekisii]|uniref:Recombinase XerC n=1 Tax=Rummeliibacillus stabekisii TaxID=241244 RepID=A0A143HC59_9BACL|nr:tyrosine recombinase XerC [Rummeliibacillus stabekisii]AMW99066.1 recombinase XerC [Rummeliibacillus stabekisii]